jgi:hypothetical protein
MVEPSRDGLDEDLSLFALEALRLLPASREDAGRERGAGEDKARSSHGGLSGCCL